MAGRKPSKAALARHELSLRLFGYCRGKCGLPHPELKLKRVAAAGTKPRTRVNPKGGDPRSIPPRKRNRGVRRILALDSGPPIRSSFPSDPRRLSGGPVIIYSVSFEKSRRKH